MLHILLNMWIVDYKWLKTIQVLVRLSIRMKSRNQGQINWTRRITADEKVFTKQFKMRMNCIIDMKMQKHGQDTSKFKQMLKMPALNDNLLQVVIINYQRNSKANDLQCTGIKF